MQGGSHGDAHNARRYLLETDRTKQFTQLQAVGPTAAVETDRVELPKGESSALGVGVYSGTVTCCGPFQIGNHRNAEKSLVQQQKLDFHVSPPDDSQESLHHILHKREVSSICQPRISAEPTCMSTSAMFLQPFSPERRQTPIAHRLATQVYFLVPTNDRLGFA